MEIQRLNFFSLFFFLDQWKPDVRSCGSPSLVLVSSSCYICKREKDHSYTGEVMVNLQMGLFSHYCLCYRPLLYSTLLDVIGKRGYSYIKMLRPDCLESSPFLFFIMFGRNYTYHQTDYPASRVSFETLLTACIIPIEHAPKSNVTEPRAALLQN